MFGFPVSRLAGFAPRRPSMNQNPDAGGSVRFLLSGAQLTSRRNRRRAFVAFAYLARTKWILVLVAILVLLFRLSLSGALGSL